jgi:hypothetical protein
MVKQLLIRKEWEKPHNPEDIVSPTSYLNVDGQKIAYFTRHSENPNGGFILIVPGVVVGEEYKTEHGALAVDVQPIDPSYRDKVRTAIKEQEANILIDFW